MKKLLMALHAAVFLALGGTAAARDLRPPSVVVSSVFDLSDRDLSYEQAKLAFDRVIKPDADETQTKAQLDQLATAARSLAADNNDVEKLKAVRQAIYETGPWNGGKSFSYDHADPYGANLHNKLLATYLATRRGNCVSMPVLHLILAERLGLNVSLSTAPLHVFVRYTNPSNGRSIPIEATSGGYLTREAWYHEKMGVTDAQVSSGIYLGTLTKRESIAVMASTVTEWLMEQKRYQDAIEVADVLLKHYPKDVHAVLIRGAAYGQLLQTEFLDRYPTPATIPPTLRARYQMLSAANAEAFAKAESWGWKAPS